MPDGVSLPASNRCVPPGVSSNLKSLGHNTTIDCFAHSIPNHATLYDDIVVQEKLFHSSVSRNLSFDPSSNNTVVWQPRTVSLSHFSVKIKEGDVAVGTSNSEHPRLNLRNKL